MEKFRPDARATHNFITVTSISVDLASVILFSAAVKCVGLEDL